MTDSDLQRYGYTDTLTWGLGHESELPTHAQAVRIDETSDLVTVQAEHLGVVTSVRREAWHMWDPSMIFFSNLKLTLESLTDISNIDELVDTLCARLYGLPPTAVHARLAGDHRRVPMLKERLIAIYNAFPMRNFPAEQFVADVLGISNTSIRPDVSPLNSLTSYAGSVHLGTAMALVYVTCDICTHTYPIFTALLKPAATILSGPTRAYRIPGLRYFAITNPGGGGLLLDADDRIVGRFVWGTPTCDCDKRGDVAVKLEGAPLPISNKFKYGNKVGMEGQWLPLIQAARIKK
jgi:hypothetical protein